MVEIQYFDIKQSADYLGVSTRTVERNIIENSDKLKELYGDDAISLETANNTKKWFISYTVLKNYKKDKKRLRHTDTPTEQNDVVRKLATIVLNQQDTINRQSLIIEEMERRYSILQKSFEIQKKYHQIEQPIDLELD